jgi:hypothetical protein
MKMRHIRCRKCHCIVEEFCTNYPMDVGFVEGFEGCFESRDAASSAFSNFL